jgi:hypothetical protein
MTSIDLVTRAADGDREAWDALVERYAPLVWRLMAMLLEDPPVPFAQIGARLGIPVESIESRRALCLDNLRHDPVIAALNTTEARSAGP